MPKNLGGHVTMVTPLLEKFLGVLSGLSLGTRVSVKFEVRSFNRFGAISI